MKGLDDHLATAVDERFTRFAAGADGTFPAPGMAWGVLMDGRLVHAGGWGTLRDGEDRTPGPDASFRIASMTKSFTSAAVLLLRDEGRLGLDDPIERHVPEAEGLVAAEADDPPISVRTLLSMSSGLPQDDAWADRLEDLAHTDFGALLRHGATPAWPARVAYEYSNLGYAILGRLVANIAGAPFHEVVAERILRPLGLTATAFADDGLDPALIAAGHHRVDESWELQPTQRPGAFSAIGGLYSSVRDITTWMAGFCDAWPGGAGQSARHLLSRATRREMQRPETTLPPFLRRDHTGRLRTVSSAYCLGLVSDEDLVTGRALSHSGGYPGFGSHMRWHPATGIGVVALANGRYAPTWKLATAALELLVAAGGESRRRPRPAPAATAARDDVDRLLVSWDDAIASRFAPNVALDEPLWRRRAKIDQLRGAHGRLERDGDVVVETPMRLRWWLAGERGGRVGVEMTLTPDVPPLIQFLEFTSIPEPPPALAAAGRAVLAALNAGGELPAGLAFADDAIGTDARVTLRDAAAHLAPVEVAGLVAGDGATTLTLRARGPAGSVDLALTMDAGLAFVTHLDLKVLEPPAWPD